jgi:hypothetical protein
MVVTLVVTTNYNEKPTVDTWSKRTQTNPTCSEPVEPILSASGVNASAGSVSSLCFLTITIYCVWPKLPEKIPAVGFGVKNDLLQKVIFNVNKWPCHTNSPWDGKAGRPFGP